MRANLSMRLWLAAALVVAARPALAEAQRAAGLPQLDPASWPAQIFWLFVHFIVLYIVMAKLVLPRLGGIVEGRAAGLAADLDAAQGMQEQATLARRNFEAALSKARQEAHTLREASLNQAKAAQAAAEQQLGVELAGRAQAAHERIAAASAGLQASLRSVAVEVAWDLVTRLSGMPADEGSMDAALSRVNLPIKEGA